MTWSLSLDFLKEFAISHVFTFSPVNCDFVKKWKKTLVGKWNDAFLTRHWAFSKLQSILKYFPNNNWTTLTGYLLVNSSCLKSKCLLVWNKATFIPASFECKIFTVIQSANLYFWKKVFKLAKKAFSDKHALECSKMRTPEKSRSDSTQMFFWAVISLHFLLICRRE